ncbi:DUF58 domain-containing protein [Anoxynatronum sibiricum]|uniref:DUF58 domain-containing protein n=1 Tax=Anoxynatronum sibiricum TaxID=210623 RepID=A0ABU9VP26_9CLOT
MKRKLYLLLGVPVTLLALLVGGRLPFFVWYAYLLVWLLPMAHGLLGKLFLRGAILVPEAELVAGEVVSVAYRVENPLPIAFPGIELENEVGYRLTGIKEPRRVFSLNGKEQLVGQSELVCRRRGLYELGHIRLLIHDIFQMNTFEKTITSPLSLKVYPRVVPISSFPIVASQQMGNLKVKDPLFQDYTQISRLRQYREGDPIKQIHWKVSAGKKNLVVKEYEERGDTEVLLLLDSSQEHYAHDPEGWVEDQLVEAAASVIDYCLRGNIKVTLQYASRGRQVRYTGNSPIYLKHFLDGLALFHPAESVSFEKQAASWTEQIPPGTALLLLTPRLTKGLAARGIADRLKNRYPLFLVFGDGDNNPAGWEENREIVKKLTLEGLSCYLFDKKQNVRDVLEGTYARRDAT